MKQVATKGIVINSIKYKDSAIIVRIYTEKLGLRSYVVHGVRSRRGKQKAALFRPLTILDLEVVEKPNRDIQTISEAKIHTPFYSFQTDFYKASIIIFLTEFLGKVLKEEDENLHLFQFLEGSLTSFEHLESSFANFHLQFMLKLPVCLGFGVTRAEDLLEEIEVVHSDDEKMIAIIDQLLEAKYDEYIGISHQYRVDILTYLIKFYQYHIQNFGTINSLDILRDIMSD